MQQVSQSGSIVFNELYVGMEVVVNCFKVLSWNSFEDNHDTELIIVSLIISLK